MTSVASYDTVSRSATDREYIVVSLGSQISARWKSLPWWGRFLLSATGLTGLLTGGIALTIVTLVDYGVRTLETSCLARTLDAKLKKFADTNSAEFRQQATLAAHVELNLAREGKIPICPAGNIYGKFRIVQEWFLSSSKFWTPSQRQVVTLDVATKVISGSYELPEKFKCARAYTASSVRVVKKMLIWLNGTYRYVDSIGTMNVYCSKVQKTAP